MTSLEIDITNKLMKLGIVPDHKNTSVIQEIIHLVKQDKPEQLILSNVSGSLPNDINVNLLTQLLKYSDKYEINIQFWPGQTAVYIEKDGVELRDFGGGFEFTITKSLEYLDRINGNDR